MSNSPCKLAMQPLCRFYISGMGKFWGFVKAKIYQFPICADSGLILACFLVKCSTLEPAVSAAALFLVIAILHICCDTKIGVLIVKGTSVSMITFSSIIALQAKNSAVHPFHAALTVYGWEPTNGVKALCVRSPMGVPLKLRQFFVAMGAHKRNLTLSEWDFAVR